MLERAVAERERRGVGVSTVERLRQAGEAALDVAVETDNEGGHLVRVERQRISQAPLDRFHARGEIDRRLFDAGDTFREDAYIAGAIWPQLTGEGSGNAAGRLPGFLRTEAAAAAMKRHVRAQQALPGALRQVVTLVCLGAERTTAAEVGIALGVSGRSSATVAGMTAIKLGLGALADHYFGAIDVRT